MNNKEKNILWGKMYSEGKFEELREILSGIDEIPVSLIGLTHRDLESLGFCKVELEFVGNSESELSITPLKGKKLIFV